MDAAGKCAKGPGEWATEIRVSLQVRGGRCSCSHQSGGNQRPRSRWPPSTKGQDRATGAKLRLLGPCVSVESKGRFAFLRPNTLFFPNQ